jgi:hypothetical protein
LRLRRLLLHLTLFEKFNASALRRPLLSKFAMTNFVE